MGALLLTRRKAQMELLAAVSERSARARVILHTPESATRIGLTKFFAIEDDSVILQWPGDGFSDAAVPGARIDVYFEFDGQRYGFNARAIGRANRITPHEGRVPVLRLSLPLRIEHKQQRESYRVSVADLEPITVQFTSVRPGAHSHAARLLNVSCGGLAVAADSPALAESPPSEPYWAEFSLPSEDRKLGFMVRRAHCRELEGGPHRFIVGWSFLPGEDPNLNKENVRRVERFVAQRQVTGARRAGNR